MLKPLTKPFEVELRSSESAPVHRRQFRFLSVTELYSLEPPPWLVKPYLDAKSLAMIFGEPGAMKTFIALDIALSIASGNDWHEQPVRQQGPVFYIAGEGLTGIGRRVKAWEISRGISLENIPFYTSNKPAQLLDSGHAMEVVAAVDELREQHGDPVLVIIDTLNRNFGPGDENSTEDMTRFISTIDEMLRARYQCAVLIIHHTGLTALERARGASALRAAVDWEYRLSEAGGVRTLTNTKTKDYEPPPPISFITEIITLEGMVDPDDGKALTSCVLHRVSRTARENRKHLRGAGKVAYDALIASIEESGETAPPEIDKDGCKIVHVAKWREAAYAAGISATDTPSAKKKAFQRAVNMLRDEGWVETRNDYWWPTRDKGQVGDNSGTCPGTK